jgi:hypothetical protein
MPPAPPGSIAYCTVQLDVYHDDGTAMLTVSGCLMASDGSLDITDPSSGAHGFNVTVPLNYGDSQSELVTVVENALSSVYGITGLTDVKFIPAF